MKLTVAVTAVVGITAVLSQTPLVREGVVTLLGKTGSDSTPVLCYALDDENVRVRQAAADALLELGPEAVSAELIRGMNDPDVAVRRRAVLAVGLMATRGSRPVGVEARLTELAGDPDPRIRATVLKSAIAFDPVGPLAGLPVPLLDDPDPLVRAGACELVWRHRITDPAVRKKVESLRDDPDSWVRTQAEEAIEHLNRGR